MSHENKCCKCEVLANLLYYSPRVRARFWTWNMCWILARWLLEHGVEVGDV